MCVCVLPHRHVSREKANRCLLPLTVHIDMCVCVCVCVTSQARIQDEIKEMSSAFDSALSLLRRDKFRLEKDLKQYEMRQLVHAQEHTLLQDFDKKEVVLIQKRSARHDDRNVSEMYINTYTHTHTHTHTDAGLSL